MLTQKQIDDAPSYHRLDTVSLDGNRFSAKTSHYVLEGKDLVGRLGTFSAEKNESLPDFLYTKPDTKDGTNKLNPEEAQETKVRSGYYPLKIVKKAFKGPNHWHREDDAIFCAVEVSEGNWETRYFPKQNIPSETWETAVRICGS